VFAGGRTGTILVRRNGAKMNFTMIEARFLAHFSRGDHPVLALLRQQLADAEVADRKQTVHGVIVTLGVSAAARRMPVDSPMLCDVGFSHPEAPTGGTATLFVRQGYAHKLQVDCYAEDWPRDHAGFTLHYLRCPSSPLDVRGVPEPSDERDMVWLVDQLDL
jgi:hypothetical protein